MYLFPLVHFNDICESLSLVNVTRNCSEKSWVVDFIWKINGCRTVRYLCQRSCWNDAIEIIRSLLTEIIRSLLTSQRLQLKLKAVHLECHNLFISKHTGKGYFSIPCVYNPKLLNRNSKHKRFKKLITIVWLLDLTK